MFLRLTLITLLGPIRKRIHTLVVIAQPFHLTISFAPFRNNLQLRPSGLQTCMWPVGIGARQAVAWQAG